MSAPHSGCVATPAAEKRPRAAAATALQICAIPTSSQSALATLSSSPSPPTTTEADRRRRTPGRRSRSPLSRDRRCSSPPSRGWPPAYPGCQTPGRGSRSSGRPAPGEPSRKRTGRPCAAGRARSSPAPATIISASVAPATSPRPQAPALPKAAARCRENRLAGRARGALGAISAVAGADGLGRAPRGSCRPPDAALVKMRHEVVHPKRSHREEHRACRHGSRRCRSR